jgi:hypothetical protein
MGFRHQAAGLRQAALVRMADAHPDAALYTAEELLRHPLMAET